ncbi:MAG: hypothetical protein AAFQ63_08740 [Cyanobacteria bacterium J06621_11]
MLTSSHYLLGGFLASSCAAGMLLQNSVPAASYLSPGVMDSSVNETIDVSYRGSGRADSDPETRDLKDATQGSHYSEVSETDLDSLDIADVDGTSSERASGSHASGGKDLVSHRGSGRVRPFSM